MAQRSNHRKWRIRSPTRLGRTTRHKETTEHDHAADEIYPVAGHVKLGERHVLRADLQRYQIISERTNRQRHHTEKHHDRTVHRAELIVKLGSHYPTGHT